MPSCLKTWTRLQNLLNKIKHWTIMKWGPKETRAKRVIAINLWRIPCTKIWAKKSLQWGTHQTKNNLYLQQKLSLSSPLLQMMRSTWWSPTLWKRRIFPAHITKSKKIRYTKEFGVRSRKEKRSRKRGRSNRWKNRLKDSNNKRRKRHDSSPRKNRSKSLSIWRKIVWSARTKKSQSSKAHK